MTLITPFRICFLLFTIAQPLVASTATQGSKNCSEKEFWSKPNGCCLPIGGPQTPPPPPPKGTSCPPTSHYWGQKQGCCVPRYPSPAQGPFPQCRKGWEWNPTVRKCLPAPTPPSPPPSTPSKHHGHNNGYNDHNINGSHGSNYGHKRRSNHLKSRSISLCPSGLDGCPISDVKAGDYECLDTTTELESCGGCTSLGLGQDCTAIVGAWNVGCDQGHCAVYTCSGGFRRARDGKTCIPL
ncbi:hypothetical protein BDZ94DRAFT_1275865 [Collybia nuda]|uniref:Protein CPL1-like domain-containing protein n=1 Tax=Collybia nuda TaxID=64659 RepID=A0A9P5XT50_9AGAR|nr:hypothetical protein BDZ94DRAFT_1275865 [Collybia nuda]